MAATPNALLDGLLLGIDARSWHRRQEIRDEQFTIPLTGFGLGRVSQLGPLNMPSLKYLSDLWIVIEREDESALDVVQAAFQVNKILIRLRRQYGGSR
jgi:hypothetical protein